MKFCNSEPIYEIVPVKGLFWQISNYFYRMKNDIVTREDIGLLVHKFYDKIRIDEELGPIFNKVITNWDEHLILLTDFWDTSLLTGKTYSGNPFTAHQRADDATGNIISVNHFGAWLNLWFATVDENFEGENAQTIKRRARKMQTPIFMSIFENRQKKSK